MNRPANIQNRGLGTACSERVPCEQGKKHPGPGLGVTRDVVFERAEFAGEYAKLIGFLKNLKLALGPRRPRNPDC